MAAIDDLSFGATLATTACGEASSFEGRGVWGCSEMLIENFLATRSRLTAVTDWSGGRVAASTLHGSSHICDATPADRRKF